MIDVYFPTIPILTSPSEDFCIEMIFFHILKSGDFSSFKLK